MTTTINADGLLRIPELFRETDAIVPGQRFEIERLGRGEYRVKAETTPNGEEKIGLVDLLLSCPVKGFFNNDWPKQTTDDLRTVEFEK